MSLLAEISLVILRHYKRERIAQQGRDVRRVFTRTQQLVIWSRQEGKCTCGMLLDWQWVVFHHTIPWHEGGRTLIQNGVALCPLCHRKSIFTHQVLDAERSRDAEHGIFDG